jgi:hypothetical protein
MRQRPTQNLGEMILVAHLDITCGLFFACRRHVERVLCTCQPDIYDASPLADRKLDCRLARRGGLVARVLLATPVLHHETQTVGVEEEPLGVTGARGS